MASDVNYDNLPMLVVDLSEAIRTYKEQLCLVLGDDDVTTMDHKAFITLCLCEPRNTPAHDDVFDEMISSVVHDAIESGDHAGDLQACSAVISYEAIRDSVLDAITKEIAGRIGDNDFVDTYKLDFWVDHNHALFIP